MQEQPATSRPRIRLRPGSTQDTQGSDTSSHRVYQACILTLTCMQTALRGIQRQAQNSLVREMLISALLPRKRIRTLGRQRQM